MTKAKRDEKIYLMMQKLLNMGLIMDQMQRGPSTRHEWPIAADYQYDGNRKCMVIQCGCHK